MFDGSQLWSSFTRIFCRNAHKEGCSKYLSFSFSAFLMLSRLKIFLLPLLFILSKCFQVDKLILIDAISPSPVPREIFLIFHHNQAKDAFKLEAGNRKPTLYSYEEALSQITNKRMSQLKAEAAKFLLERNLKKIGSKYAFTTDPRIRSEIKPAIGEDVLLDQFRQIKCPVLVILAKNSEIFSLVTSPGFYATVLDILERTHVTSTTVRVAGNHCVHNNQPEVIAPIINKFLALRISKF